MTSRITFGYATDIGKVRKHQEDAVYTFFAAGNEIHPDFGLFIVCDGMGGKGLGEKAAALAIQSLALKIQQTIYLPLLNSKSVTGDEITQALVEGVQQGNAAILQWGETHPDERGAGTCLTTALVLDRTAYIAHVGDTRCYAVQREKLEQITEDHNLVTVLIKAGHITQEEADENPGDGHRLYRALGQMPELDVDVHRHPLQAEMTYLLCTDGISWWLKNDGIFEAVRTSHDAQHACDRLIAAANERGGNDNSAVIIISNDFPFAEK